MTVTERKRKKGQRGRAGPLVEGERQSWVAAFGHP